MPASSADSSWEQLDFWPHKGTTEWVWFEWKDKHDMSRVKVYWFDDTGRGQCHLPQAWQVFYRTDRGDFEPVKNGMPYGVAKDAFNQVGFEPVRTDAIKIEVSLQDGWSAGVQEVIIE